MNEVIQQKLKHYAEVTWPKIKHGPFLPGDYITLNTGFSCDTGVFIRYEDNIVVWAAYLGGTYKSPMDKYDITLDPNYIHQDR